MSQQSHSERKIPRRWQLATFFLIGLFLPLTVLLSMIPGSWYRAEGYEDLGVMEFEAVRHEGRGSNHVKYYVIYQALDSSGITVRERVYFVTDAREAVENKEHITRHVYRAYDAPNFILRRVRNAGYQFFQEGKEPESLEAFQKGLDGARKIAFVGQSVGLCYIAGFTALLLRRRAIQKQDVGRKDDRDKY